MEKFRHLFLDNVVELVLMVLILVTICCVGVLAEDDDVNYNAREFTKNRMVAAQVASVRQLLVGANTVYSAHLGNPNTQDLVPLWLTVQNLHATAVVYVEPNRSTCYNTTGAGGTTTAGSKTFTLGTAITGLRVGDLIALTTANANFGVYAIERVNSTSSVNLVTAATSSVAGTQAWSLVSPSIQPMTSRSFDTCAEDISLQTNTANSTVEITVGYQRRT